MSAVEEAKTVPTTETVEELKEQQKGTFRILPLREIKLTSENGKAEEAPAAEVEAVKEPVKEDEAKPAAETAAEPAVEENKEDKAEEKVEEVPKAEEKTEETPKEEEKSEEKAENGEKAGMLYFWNYRNKIAPKNLESVENLNAKYKSSINDPKLL